MYSPFRNWTRVLQGDFISLTIFLLQVLPLSVGSAILSTTTGAGRRSTTSQWRWLIATSGRQMSLTSTGRTWSGTTPTPSPRPKTFQTHQKRPSAEKPPKLVSNDLIKSWNNLLSCINRTSFYWFISLAFGLVQEFLLWPFGILHRLCREISNLFYVFLSYCSGG